ncbi:MAG: MFS transporter [Ruminococcaceae bacterium]|nr:MFS transporter [Oscillospiraceae bacterium]
MPRIMNRAERLHTRKIHAPPAGLYALLMLDSLSHLLVDALCAATVLGGLRASSEELSAFILVYNTLAFSTQCLVGLAADRLRRHAVSASASILLIVAGFALPLPSVLRVCCVGVGNSVFHVAGGAMTLERSGGRAGALGVFVAPGAIGLALGTLWPELGAVFAALLALCALAVIPLERRAPEPDTPPAEDGGESELAVPLLALAVAVRAVGGSAVSFPWKSGAALSLLTVLFVFAGKTAGGWVCDRLGARRTALLSIIPAALLIAFCSAWAVPSLIGQFALNLTMPVTLWLLYRAMPDAPAFAFGLAASALWPGTIAGQLMTLTGPALWGCVLVSFLFGLWAILYAEKKIGEGRKEHEAD